MGSSRPIGRLAVVTTPTQSSTLRLRGGRAMIHVVTAANRHLYSEALAEMHRLRRIHFVEERGWTGLTVRDGGEYDAYDDEHAIYLLGIEANGSVSCSARM